MPGDLCVLLYPQEMQEDQQKQLKDMKENIGYYQKKAQELEVLIKTLYVKPKLLYAFESTQISDFVRCIIQNF